MATTAPRRRRHSAAVYRRRRLVVLLAAIAVVAAVVWLLVAQPWRALAAQPVSAPVPTASTPAPAPTAPVTSGPTTAPDANPLPAEGAMPSASAAPSTAAPPAAGAQPSLTPTAEPCKAAALAVQAVTDQDTYASGQNPQLSITLTNTSATGCTLNVGTSTQKFTIKSGNDVWWRSTDCQTQPSDMIVLLAAGQSVTSATPIAWDRTRSSVDSCTATDRQRAPGGGASYHLSVEIGGVAAPQTKQILLY
ncbi:hypothetical protein [Microbacterium sp. CJ88]|uniref:hypothetical protein n=1 Tax=Microbacterium sp. CJ88 TaxID=3445672 RepID=UPI003F65C7EA